MQEDSTAQARRPEEYFLFAIVFAGLGLAGAGVIISSVAIAITGATAALIGLLGFR